MSKKIVVLLVIANLLKTKNPCTRLERQMQGIFLQQNYISFETEILGIMRLFTCLKQGLKEPKSKKQTADNSSHNTSPLILP